MVNQQENQKHSCCRNNCIYRLCRHRDHGEPTGDAPVFFPWDQPQVPHTEGLRPTAMHPQRWTKVVRMQTVNVQCAERALGGTGELSAEIVEKGGQSESRIALERTGNLTGNHWEELQGDSSKVKVKQLLWREHVYSKKKMSLEIKTGLFPEPSFGHFVVENSNARLIILWAWISNF